MQGSSLNELSPWEIYKKDPAVREDRVQHFGEVLDRILVLSGISQTDFAFQANLSQSYVSKLITGNRTLNAKLAERFARVLGGTVTEWMSLDTERKESRERLRTFDKEDEVFAGNSKLNSSRVSLLRSAEIKQIFDPANDGSFRKGASSEDCEIEDFSPDCVSITSYDTRAAYTGTRHPNGDWDGDLFGEELDIPARSHRFVGTRECITLPSWLEAELHPASNIALKPLIVSHGPVIDPGWHGRLYVAVYNPTDAPITISHSEPFLTLRFWVAETDAART